MSLCLFPSTVSVLRNALKKWHVAWERRFQPPKDLTVWDTFTYGTPAKMDGWVRHAPEFHILASVMLDNINDVVMHPKAGGNAATPSTDNYKGDFAKLISRAHTGRVQEL